MTRSRPQLSAPDATKDLITANVRDALRAIRAAEINLEIQRLGIDLAQRRVEFANLLFFSGAAKDNRDVVEAQVRTTDILPTVLDLTRVTAPPKLDGESLQPYFTGTGTDASERIALGETDYPLRFGWAPLRSVRTQSLKFIEAPRPELFDLHADAAELNNQYEPWNAQVKKLRGMLAGLRAKAPPPAPSQGVVGQGTIDELKALGYLGKADVGSATNVPEPSLLPDPKDKIEEQNLLHLAMIASARPGSSIM